MFDRKFADLADGFSARFGGPFIDAQVTSASEPVLDRGGSITTPGTVTVRACRAQFSAPDQRMRGEEGFEETDTAVHILAASLSGTIDTGVKVSVATGVNAGAWAVMTVRRDSGGVGYVCRARRA